MAEQPPAVTQLCGTREAACICELPPGHAGAHVCGCGGSWLIDALGAFHIISMPGEVLPTIDGDSGRPADAELLEIQP